MTPSCSHCGEDLEGRRSLYCTERCRGRARRRWERGLRADAYNGAGGRRGRLPMGQPTRLERMLEEAREEGRVFGQLDSLLAAAKEEGVVRDVIMETVERVRAQRGERR